MRRFESYSQHLEMEKVQAQLTQETARVSQRYSSSSEESYPSRVRGLKQYTAFSKNR